MDERLIIRRLRDVCHSFIGSDRKRHGSSGLGACTVDIRDIAMLEMVVAYVGMTCVGMAFMDMANV